MHNMQYNQEDNSVTISWSLFDLPTAQHKAGLAGLYAYVTELPKIAPDEQDYPSVVSVSPSSLKIRFSEATFKTLFNDLYAGQWEEDRPVKKKLDKESASIKLKRVEEKDGEKLYVYERLIPRANFIRYMRDNNPNDPWVKLWQSAVRRVLRAGGGTEKIFSEPNTKAYDNSKELKKLWQDLLKTSTKATPKNVDVPTAVYVGAEGTNAERIKFKGDITHNLLLHFWCLMSPVYPLRMVEFTKKEKAKFSYKGFVWVIPEVADLKKFDALSKKFLINRKPEVKGRFPAQSIIDLRGEGVLVYLHALIQQKVKGLEAAIASMDIYHLDKRGNNVKMLAAENMPFADAKKRMGKYQRIVEGKHHFLFKKLLLDNLLNGDAWYQNFAKMAADIPAEFFVESPKTPPDLGGFGSSVRGKFQGIIRHNKEAQHEQTT